MVRIQRALTEVIGTFLLVFFGVGTAVTDINQVGPLGVALAFGLTLVVLAYAIGPISGCHINPAVTLGIVLTRGISGAEACVYVIAQIVGAILAGGLLRFMVTFGGVVDHTESLGANGWKSPVNTLAAFVVEVMMTALLVVVVLLTAEIGAGPLSGLAIGLALAVDHLVGIPLTGTSANPARSIGSAVWYAPALSQLWLFIVAPLLGGVLAVGIYEALTLRPLLVRKEG
jgi:aquaporin Z